MIFRINHLILIIFTEFRFVVFHKSERASCLGQVYVKDGVLGRGWEKPRFRRCCSEGWKKCGMIHVGMDIVCKKGLRRLGEFVYLL